MTQAYSYSQRIDDFINDIFSRSNGVVIGESHFSRAPLKFLIDNAEKLSSMGFRYLFTEKFESPAGKYSCRAGSRFNEKYQKYLIDESNEDMYLEDLNQYINYSENKKEVIDVIYNPNVANLATIVAFYATTFK